MCTPTRLQVLLCLLLAGCGAPRTIAIGFVNQTGHSDAELWNLWIAAQKSVSRQIDMNPLEQELNNTSPKILPGDSRALNVSPHQIVVSSEPDVLAATLYVDSGMNRSDPTGLISCPQPCNVNFAPAYSLFRQPATYYAASWEFTGNNFDTLVEYEFENHILHALGYDLRWR